MHWLLLGKTVRAPFGLDSGEGGRLLVLNEGDAVGHGSLKDGVEGVNEEGEVQGGQAGEVQAHIGHLLVLEEDGGGTVGVEVALLQVHRRLGGALGVLVGLFLAELWAAGPFTPCPRSPPSPPPRPDCCVAVRGG